jgi:hypothetical protein
VLNGLASNAVLAVRFVELFLDREIVLAFDWMRGKRYIGVCAMAGRSRRRKRKMPFPEGYLAGGG